MAKISARGATTLATAKHEDGRRLVLRNDGAVLGNHLKGDPLKVFNGPSRQPMPPYALRDAFKTYAARRGFRVVRG